MLRPQNLTNAAAAVELEGQEGTLLRKVIGWSLGMLVILSSLIALQATPVLSRMPPLTGAPRRAGGHREKCSQPPGPPS